MDELIAVGTAGLIGLAALALLLAGAAVWVAGLIWTTWILGDTAGLVRILAILAGLAVLYLGTGLWLQKSGRI